MRPTAAISSAAAPCGSIQGSCFSRQTSRRLSVQKPEWAQIPRLSWIVIPSPG